RATGQSDAEPPLDKKLSGIPEKGDQVIDVDGSPFVFGVCHRSGDKRPRSRPLAPPRFAGSTIVKRVTEQSLILLGKVVDVEWMQPVPSKRMLSCQTLVRHFERPIKVVQQFTHQDRRRKRAIVLDRLTDVAHVE